MPCPYCQSTITRERATRTQLGYRTFHCQGCKRTFNERTGTPFNHLTFPTDIILQVVLWRLRYKLSLRDLAEIFLERGLVFTHEAVRAWEARFAPLLSDQLRAKRVGQAGKSWYVDETYVKVNGQWCFLYRAIDREGNLVDSMLSQTRDMDAAQRFFRQAQVVAGQAPERVTTDGHSAMVASAGTARAGSGRSWAGCRWVHIELPWLNIIGAVERRPARDGQTRSSVPWDRLELAYHSNCDRHLYAQQNQPGYQR